MSGERRERERGIIRKRDIEKTERRQKQKKINKNSLLHNDHVLDRTLELIFFFP